ncbi:MAG: NAD(+) diphosphatase, partial [Aestuariivirgaceae bacterium]
RQVIVKLVADRAVVRDDGGGIALAYFDEAPGDAMVHLGVIDSDTAILGAAIEESEAPLDHVLIDLRRLAMEGLLPPHELALLAQARSLLVWHERHSFCSNCGQPTVIADAGYRRDCPGCKAQHFPRTDPVVITAVSGPRGWLLGRGHGFQPGVYSTLAGFMEPGESIEEAARREVFEETGVRLGAVAYHSSQPWPFPSSLMIGLLAQATTSEIAIAAEELEDARWFGRDEVVQMLENRHPQGLKVPKPAAIAHHLIRASIAQD